MESFETKRLIFRALCWDNLAELYALYSRPGLMQYISGQPCTYEQTKHLLRLHIQDHEHHGFGLYGAYLKSGKRMIGRCGLVPLDKESGLEGDLAWMFQQAYWNQGLAAEFAQEMIQIGFEQLGLRRIQATAANQNLASIRVMQKVGMRFVKSDEQGTEYELLPTLPG